MQQLRERAEACPAIRLAPAMIKPWTLQPQLAKRGAKNNVMTTFARTVMAALGTGAL